MDKIRMKISQVVLPLLMVAGMLCGCAPQKNLAHRLKGADRVVAANTKGLSFSITGEEVDKLVQAIAASKKESPLIDAAVGLRLDFYKGTGHLGTVITSDQVFWVEKTPYSDTTETLKGIYQRAP